MNVMRYIVKSGITIFNIADIHCQQHVMNITLCVKTLGC